ncbi:MAG: MBL fold metallo-hydrolase [Acidimicrobiales bacterium]
MLQWKVGEATITSIAETQGPTSPRFLFSGIGKQEVLARAEAASWLRPHFISDDGYLLMRIQCLVVDIGDHRIAVDTCVGNNKVRHSPDWNNLQLPFLEDLTAAGYPPESITHVVCTHLHVDHVGWNTRLVDGAWVPTFTNARYLFARTEYDHWKNTPDLFGDDVFGDSVAPIHDAGLADLVPVDHRISDNVWFESTPGHTPGHISLIVESAGQRAVITGDMVHTPMQIDDPELAPVVDSDQAQSRASRREAFARWSESGALVIGTHFPEPTAGRMVNLGNGKFRLDV